LKLASLTLSPSWPGEDPAIHVVVAGIALASVSRPGNSAFLGMSVRCIPTWMAGSSPCHDGIESRIDGRQTRGWSAFADHDGIESEPRVICRFLCELRFSGYTQKTC
jgi:hypothetical protein